ncbi:uncharacterized protein LOC116358549, partial [Oncorhynchus kisutch]|uniref:uncharacterized protein LOC116358549 n=1 Tax=Oncorhynchus kisutch TaxID=8019 RepID=UPI0012DD74AB
RCEGVSFQQTIQPNQHEVYGEEGSNVQLSCNYSSKYSVLWYKEYPGSAPHFILFILHASRTVVRAKPSYSHLTVKLNRKDPWRSPLLNAAKQIDSAQLVHLLHILPSTMLFCSLLLFFDLIGVSSEQVLTPYTDVEVASERDRVTLSCNYTASVNTLQWYRQYPKSEPQLLVMEYEAITPGFTLNHDNNVKRMDLEISSAEVTDTALYYCALKPTVTGNPETLYKNLTSPMLFQLCSSRFYLTIMPSSGVNMHPFYWVKRLNIMLHITCNEWN